MFLQRVQGVTQHINFGDGRTKEKQELLKQWISNGENAKSVEASIEVTRSQSGEVCKGRELLTIKEMVDKKFSQFFGYIYVICFLFGRCVFFCFKDAFSTGSLGTFLTDHTYIK